MEETFDLDEQARLALDVAQHAAMANGDSHCGTEYLLYGLVATGRGSIVELSELFALNVLRIDRAIERLVETRKRKGIFVEGPPMLSLRARRALSTSRLDGSGPTGTFEVLHGLLGDDDAGACEVLRYLGVVPDEARRLVAYGIQHLTQSQVDELISSLDRRSADAKPWWGPEPGRRLRSIAIDGRSTIPVAESDSATVEVTAVGSDGRGFGFTLTTTSRRSWVLPPLFVPNESLIPGLGARYSDGPDFFLLQLLLPDGAVLDNRHASERFGPHPPPEPRLLRLGQRDERTTLNDRRQSDQHVVITDWWAWPLPVSGTVELRVGWPAESIFGNRKPCTGRPAQAVRSSAPQGESSPLTRTTSSRTP